MKRTTKAILTAALFCMVLGLLLAGIAFLASGGKLGVYGNPLKWTYSHEPKMAIAINETLDEFSTIIVDSKYTDVELKEGTGYGLEFTGRKEHGEVFYEQNGKTLTVTRSEAIQLQSSFNFQTSSEKLVITYPAGISLDEITVKSASGRIVCSDIKGNIVDLRSNYGSVVAQNLQVDTVTITSDSGKIRLKNVTASEATLHSSYGEVILTEATLSKQLTIKSQSGKVVLTDVTAQASDMDLTHGSLRASNVVLTDTTVSAQSGAITINGSLMGKTAIASSYGSIDLSLRQSRSELALSLQVQHGSIYVGGEKVEGRQYTENSGAAHALSAESNSGQIKINFS